MSRAPSSICLAVALVIAASAPARAEVRQPNGTVIPTEPGCSGGRPTGLAAVFSCVCVEDGVCNIGEVCESESVCDDGVNGTCETTMSHVFNDNTCIPSRMTGIDPRAEASTTPQTFSPVCPLTFTVASRGTALFQDGFGWYNVNPDGPPDPDDLHVMLTCDAAPGDDVVLDIYSEPDYRGGGIGFFLVTPESAGGSSCAGGNCCATVERAQAGEGHIFFSQSDYNPDYVGAESLIHLLTYDSHVWTQKFYFAWEDLYGGSNNDFTDLVTAVTGVECAGGGQACDTGLDGICDNGVTQCVGETLECIQYYGPEPAERCDGLDNDCNGLVDDDVVCPEENEVCSNGRCVPNCSMGDEFACYEDLGYICVEETGFCVEEDCLDVDCPSDQVCQGGDCVGGCEGVVCPHGQSCRLGSCIDACAGVTCTPPQVCSEGICVNGCGQCSGIVCESPLQCDEATGHCLDPSCTGDCGDGTHCSGGSCVDDCDGAVCPAGQLCVDGDCRFPEADADADADADGDGDGDGDGDSDADADADADGSDVHVSSSCSCRAGGAEAAPSVGTWLLAAGLGLFVVRAASQRSSNRP